MPRMRGLLLLTASESHWINCLQWGEDKFPNRKECGTHGDLLLGDMRKLDCQFWRAKQSVAKTDLIWNAASHRFAVCWLGGSARVPSRA